MENVGRLGQRLKKTTKKTKKLLYRENNSREVKQIIIGQVKAKDDTILSEESKIML